MNRSGENGDSSEESISDSETAKKSKKVKIMCAKKNLIDPTASLNYCLGVSIVQLALGITSFCVSSVDIVKASNLGP